MSVDVLEKSSSLHPQNDDQKVLESLGKSGSVITHHHGAFKNVWSNMICWTVNSNSHPCVINNIVLADLSWTYMTNITIDRNCKHHWMTGHVLRHGWLAWPKRCLTHQLRHEAMWKPHDCELQCRTARRKAFKQPMGFFVLTMVMWTISLTFGDWSSAWNMIEKHVLNVF